MEHRFDIIKDEINKAQHKISLERAFDMEIVQFVEDDRFDYGETRYRAWGYIDGKPHFLAYTVRHGKMRPISLRRAHAKEMKRHVKEA
ncbi:MAG TPA: BrnT family toxin [Rhodopseudomonas sp.]|uniref:BrnT family toxin n=1 Tax=Rhodopseudomonas sp. TaxID=1078 RepID=UPI002ED816B4